MPEVPAEAAGDPVEAVRDAAAEALVKIKASR
jgi:hypothetical protein